VLSLLFSEKKGETMPATDKLLIYIPQKKLKKRLVGQ